METLTKCLLLPIDGTSESLRPIAFISRLYPVSEVSLILCYFSPPPPPVYFSLAAETPEMQKKKRDLVESRQRDAQRIFTHAKKVLMKAGFSRELIQEHIEQREMSVAKQACLLADIRKVDAVVIQKRVSSSLEGFLIGDPASALLQYCLTSPVWFVEGEANPSRAAICVVDEDAALRMTDHAGYMLSGSAAQITLLQTVRKLSAPISFHPSNGTKELAGHAGMTLSSGRYSYLLRAADMLREYGIDEGRIQITLIPEKGDIASEILSWCASNGIGVVGLGHSEPEGIWSSLKTSVTRKILADFKNMAIWVAQ
jgi:nucleotide-binding universal stress UspA family protein